MNTDKQEPAGRLISFPVSQLATVDGNIFPDVEPPDNISTLPIRSDAPLWMIVDRKYRAQTVTFEARIHQRMDIPTIDRAIDQEKPSYMSVETFWKEIGGHGNFRQPTWSEHARYFGTLEMYTDPAHKDTIHGEMHQDKGRVPALVEILGQYKRLNSSDMKILRVAASVHDMGRENDMDNPNHGLVAARNVDGTNEDDPTKNYLATYKERGIKFTPEESTLLKILCVYHEKPWEVIPLHYRQDKRIATLIQTLQAADGLDRFRSPDPDWRPLPKFFMRFFDNDTHKIQAAFEFAKYFALYSEKYRLENNVFAEQAMQNMLAHIGFLRDETQYLPPNNPSLLRRQVAYGGLS